MVKNRHQIGAESVKEGPNYTRAIFWLNKSPSLSIDSCRRIKRHPTAPVINVYFHVNNGVQKGSLQVVDVIYFVRFWLLFPSFNSPDGGVKV
jgi:hypothetical protein